MLDIAINHIEELKKKMNNIWFDEKYKFYNNSLYYSDFRVDDDTWNRHQFVSLNKDGDILGYIDYSINRQTNSCSNVGIINFSDDKMTFSLDIGRVFKDMFEKFKFNKVNFVVVIGNPIEKSYDKLVSKYGGRIVGTYLNEAKLIDGEFYDVKAYEILRENYILSIHPKTYKDDFLEKFPNAIVDDGGYPICLICMFSLYGIRDFKCNDNCYECWDTVMRSKGDDEIGNKSIIAHKQER